MDHSAAPEVTETAQGTDELVVAPDSKLSQMLESIAADESRERISFGDLLETLHGRAFGALMIIFAFPNILPSPPGLAGVLGLPLVFLSTQMMFGRLPWLPDFIARRSLPRASFSALFTRATPWLARAEKLLRHRLAPLTTPVAQRLVGLVCLVLSLVLMLPIPLGNSLPSIAICLFALGILERDGLWIIGGLLFSAFALTFVGGMAYAVIKSALFVLLNAF
ncbi:MAG: exopolysaccharide biosynthesis protein [Paracoccaceae bacterium]